MRDRGAQRVAAALAMLTLGACAAHSFSIGGGTSTGGGGASGPPSSSDSSGWVNHQGGEVAIDSNDPVTSGTDRANASTPNNAGRAAHYPPGIDDSGTVSGAYGPPGARRGDGYFEENAQRWTILAGYTVDEATRRARATGFHGEIKVSPLLEFDTHCAEGTVCSVVPMRWQISNETLYLQVNRTVKISSPTE